MAERRIISTADAAAPAAFYSQAVRAGDLVFTAGCVGVNPASGDVEPGGFEPQTRRTLRNIDGILRAAGSSLEDIVKVTCFLTRMEDFPAFDAVYREFFEESPPARTTVVCDLVREEFLVEIEAVALVP